jgi:hypothetical protein
VGQFQERPLLTDTADKLFFSGEGETSSQEHGPHQHAPHRNNDSSLAAVGFQSCAADRKVRVYQRYRLDADVITFQVHFRLPGVASRVFGRRNQHQTDDFCWMILEMSKIRTTPEASR